MYVYTHMIWIWKVLDIEMRIFICSSCYLYLRERRALRVKVLGTATQMAMVQRAKLVWKSVYVFDFGPYVNILIWDFMQSLSRWNEQISLNAVSDLNSCSDQNWPSFSGSQTGARWAEANVLSMRDAASCSSVPLRRPMNICNRVSPSVRCQPLQRLLLSLSLGS